MAVSLEFTKSLPKIELHAHLSGSISRQCLHEIWETAKARDPTLALEDPLISMPVGKVDYDINSFFPLFSNYIYKLCNTPETITHSTTSVLQDFQNDGVVYLELRTTPRASPHISKDTYISLILDCIDNFSRTTTTTTTTMSTYLILSIDRSNTAAEAAQVIDLALKYRSRGIVGIDLCGNPTKGNISIYRDAFARAKAGGLKLTLHFAEVPASSTIEELETLLSYNPERLGHVINVSEEIKREIIARKLGLELCLSCNVHANLISGGFPAHHFGYWQETGNPIILCTDDVSIFASPLSQEYFLLAHHFGLSPADLIALCKRGIGAIFGPEEGKLRLKNIIAGFEELRVE